MKKLKEYKPYFQGLGVAFAILLVLGLIFKLLTLPSDKEIVIRNPIIIRSRIISPIIEENLEKEWLEKELLKKVDSLLEDRIGGEGETSLRPVKPVLAGQPSPTPTISLALVKNGSDKELLLALTKKFTTEYGSNYDMAICILRDESNFQIDPCWGEASCDNGKAMGPWQFHCGTWQSFRKQMGLNTDCNLRGDPIESTRTAAWAFAQGYQWHWTSVKTGECQ